MHRLIAELAVRASPSSLSRRSCPRCWAWPTACSSCARAASRPTSPRRGDRRIRHVRRDPRAGRPHDGTAAIAAKSCVTSGPCSWAPLARPGSSRARARHRRDAANPASSSARRLARPAAHAVDPHAARRRSGDRHHHPQRRPLGRLRARPHRLPHRHVFIELPGLPILVVIVFVMVFAGGSSAHQRRARRVRQGAGPRHHARNAVHLPRYQRDVDRQRPHQRLRHAARVPRARHRSSWGSPILTIIALVVLSLAGWFLRHPRAASSTPSAPTRRPPPLRAEVTQRVLVAFVVSRDAGRPRRRPVRRPLRDGHSRPAPAGSSRPSPRPSSAASRSSADRPVWGAAIGAYLLAPSTGRSPCSGSRLLAARRRRRAHPRGDRARPGARPAERKPS